MTENKQNHNIGARSVTLGCRLNTYEAELMKQHAQEAGLDDVVIVNTCAVTSEAERQSRQTIRRLRKKNPHSKIIVTGCSAQIHPETYCNMDEVDYVMGNHDKLKKESWQTLEEDLETKGKSVAQVNDIMALQETALHLLHGFSEKTRAFVQVQTGCDHRCTFCIIPYGRGNSRSVPSDFVVEQIRGLVSSGYQEVVLTGVDLTDYGNRLEEEMSLGKLVKKILKEVPSLSRLRISSLDCIEIDDDLLACFADPRIMPHLHLSLQSGDNMILKRMKRRHSRDDAIELCRKIRAVRPDMVFGADFIVGFPTETEEMFQNTLKIVDECFLAWLHVFPYSEREGTPAARIPNQIPKEERQKRASLLRQKGEESMKTLLEEKRGQKAQILIENKDNGHGYAVGRSEHFIPVFVNKDDVRDRDVVSVMLEERHEHGLYGRVI